MDDNKVFTELDMTAAFKALEKAREEIQQRQQIKQDKTYKNRIEKPSYKPSFPDDKSN